MNDRTDHRRAFLAHAGLDAARIEPLPADASTRTYARLRRDGRAPLLLMDAPPVEDSPPCAPDATPQARVAAGYNAASRLAASRVDAFVAVDMHLRGCGLSAPEVVAYDAELGFAVLEDLGTGAYARLIENGADPLPYYQTAVDVLIRLHEAATPDRLPIGKRLLGRGEWPLLSYDDLALKTGADLFPAWWPAYAPAVAMGPDALAEWDVLWAPIRVRGEEGASVFAHRDYHAENLLWLPDRVGVARVGLLDFQDAVRAHPAWDLLSLLQDARRDVAPELEAAMLERYFAARPQVERLPFLADYAALAALNNARITGLFARLIVRDAKPRYRAFLPRMLGLLRRNLAHPDLARLKAWFERYVPEEARA